MGRQKFIEAAPKLIAEAFAEVGAAAVDGTAFILEHNKAYVEMLNKFGLTLFAETEYSNPLQVMYQGAMTEGDVLEMIAVQVESWIDDASIDPNAHPTRDQLKQYPAKVMASYSDLSGVITAPVTIYDKAARRAMTSAANVDKFYMAQLLAMRNAIDQRRFMLAKQLLHRVLTDDAANEDRHITIPITGIKNGEDATNVWAVINGLINELRVNTSKYNIRGYNGQVSLFDANGNPNFLIIGRATTTAQLQTYAAQIFHKDSLNMSGVDITLTDSFGGETSNVAPVYAEDDGQQTANMAAATWTDPHAKTQFILCERDAFIATTDWEDVESRRDTGARATTFEPLSSHHFAHIPFKPFIELSFQ